MHFLRDVIVLAGAGVGGGSLVYANTLYVPAEFSTISSGTHHRLARGARAVLRTSDPDARRYSEPNDDSRRRRDEEVADEMGVGDTFKLTPVGVFFSAPAGQRLPTRSSEALARSAMAASDVANA